MDDYQIEDVSLEIERRLDELSNKRDQLSENLTEADVEALEELQSITDEINAIRQTLETMDTDDDENPQEDIEVLDADTTRLEERLEVLLQAVSPDSTVTI